MNLQPLAISAMFRLQQKKTIVWDAVDQNLKYK